MDQPVRVPDPRIAALRPADQTVSIRTYLTSLLARRDYVWHVAKGQLRSQQMDTVLGNLWHLLNPLLSVFIYWLMFDVVLGTSRGVENYVAFLSVGTFVFSFSQRATMAGARSISGNKNLLRSIWFPRALLPITSSVTELLTFFPSLVVLFIVCMITGETPQLTWLLLPALIAMQMAFNLGAAMIAARLANHVPDLHQLLPFIFRLLFYVSGVIFLVDAYVEHSRARLLFQLNPFYSFITLYRWAVLGMDVSLTTAIVAPVWAAVLLAGGFWWFRQAEREYGNG